jgi:YD repeat-containing protein
VITNKTLSSGGTWTFDYTPGSPSNFDITTVTTPSGTITYRHVGPNYSISGTVWMVGLLMSRQVGSVLTETNFWDKQKISSQNNFRPGAFVQKVDTGEVNAPILTSRTIVQNGATHTSSYSGFDAYGNPGLVTESGPNGGARSRSLTYNYNTSKWIVRQVKDDTVSGGVSILRSIDSNGNVLSVSRDGVVTSHGYDSQGSMTSTTFPRSLTHTYSSYRRGIAQVENQPEGISISRVISDAGNVTSETNGEQRTTTYTYDGLNRVTGITPPIGSPTAISYTATSKTAARGALTETTNYDGFGRPASITLGGIARSYQHDALGRMTFASNPGASVGTTYQYDMLDRVTRITNADNTLRAISFGAGSKTITDERSNATRYNYRSYGDPAYQVLASVVAPDASANVSISVNGRDLIDSISQAGLTRTMGYNTAGHLTSVTNPETGTTTYGRDPAGNMTNSSVGASGTTTYSYDGQNRMSSVTYPGAPQAVTHTYTRTGRMKSVAAASAAKGFSYDSNDNLVGESIVVDGLTFATGYGYNGLDQLSTIVHPHTGRLVNYAPSALGRPTQVSGFAPSISYWPSGLLQQINYANGAVSRYSQHASRLWPSGFSTTGNATTYIDSAYGYDGVGNLSSVSDVADPAYNRNFGYDAIDRLTSASGPWGSGTIAYNGAGNIVQQTYGSSGLSYSYSAQNRLSSVTGARVGSFGYDARGNITSAPGATYAYDGAPNLTCANCSDAAQRTDYAYDGMNRRVSSTKAGIKTYEVYGFNGNLLLEYSAASGGKLVEYVYLGGKRIAQVQTGAEPSTTEILGATSAIVGSTWPYTIYVNPAGGYAVVKLNGQVVGQGQAAYRQICPIAPKDQPPILCKPQAPTLTVPITFTAPGVHTVTAEFPGDSLRLPSSIAHVVTVTSDPTKPDPTPPSLSFASCSSVSSTAPTPATMTCTLSNSGQTAASSVGYNTAAGTAVSGPSGSCAAGAVCGTVTVTTGIAAGTYSGTLTATPNTGRAASQAINLLVNAATGGGEWIYCSAEWGTCQLPAVGNWEVRYGSDSSAVQSATLTFANVSSVGCSNSVFGDPAPGIVKQCYYKNTVSAPPPALSLSGCSSNSPSVAPAAATMTCSLSNTGSAAGSISYTGAAGTTVSGPTGPCAADVTCGTVTVTTGTAAGTYSGTLTATPNTGSAASQAINLVVNAATGGGEWIYCGAEWGTCQLPSTGNWEVRYGPDSSAVQSTTLTFANVSSVACSNSAFGDPAPGTVKSCYYRAPPPVWTLCASEWGTCVLPAVGNYSVLYGPNPTSTETVVLDFRDVSSVSCSNGVFGDPAPGIVKNCYYRR